ncbi:uncharacterized protein L201_002913 [Kwoniella dendrophila CBS 6074]|uniref:Large ribosomal subunit protein mL49 n=1 Tax=Kwoniella dendrophila CBS 6074 TaxID=1295534 RepID=A0AAX4JS94_9TREE
MRSTISALARIATRGKRPPPPLPPTTLSSINASPSSSSTSSASFPSSSSSLASSSSTNINSEQSEAAKENWFHVNRSEGGKLPVYLKIRNGGSITTIIRKVDGDVRTLQNQLTAYLAELHIDPFTHSPKVTVRPTNNHLQIKGHWVEEVKGYLEGRGF